MNFQLCMKWGLGLQTFKKAQLGQSKLGRVRDSVSSHLLWHQQTGPGEALTLPHRALRIGMEDAFWNDFNFIHLVFSLWKSLYSSFFQERRWVESSKNILQHDIKSTILNRMGSMHKELHFCCIPRYSGCLKEKHLCNCLRCEPNCSYLSWMPFLLKGQKR